ncbi:hypothetical protein BC941DRAFT_472537 [Chlamydoabsidia padenii]|nr:hypothetical protein BC941DRAFT_472537 [Chlamydoabsidia padenii]
MTTLKSSIDNTLRVPRNINQSRINNFLAETGQFYGMGIHQDHWKTRLSGAPHVKLGVYSVPNLKRITFKEAVAQKFDPIVQQMRTFDGAPQQGLTGGSDQSRHEYILTHRSKKDQTFSFYIEAACNGIFGVGSNDAMVPNPNRYFSIKKADLVVRNTSLQQLYHDLMGIAYDTTQESSRARQALWTLNEVINLFIIHDSSTTKKCLDLTKAFLSTSNGQGEHQITSIGHCHIDTARYPGYIFTASQVQQYEWLQELYPHLFLKIKKQEKAGRWEIIGGSWVDHDTNMPSGESLCR